MSESNSNSEDKNSFSSESDNKYKSSDSFINDSDESEYEFKQKKWKNRKKITKFKKKEEKKIKEFIKEHEDQHKTKGKLIRKKLSEDEYENLEKSQSEKNDSVLENNSNLEKDYFKHFDPEEIKDHFWTDEDKVIIEKDMPERLQMRFFNFGDKKDDYFQEESVWLCENLIHIHNLDSKEFLSLQKKILKIWEFLRIGNYEIMYIWQHKIHELDLKEDKDKIVYKLKIEDFWYIYDNDLNWPIIYQFKYILNMLLGSLSALEPISSEIQSSFDKCYDLKILQYYYDFVIFRMKKYMDEFQINQKIIETNNVYFNKHNYEVKKTIKKNNIKILFDNPNIKDILDKIGLSAEHFYDNLSKQKIVNQPYFDHNIDIGNLFNQFINKDIFLLSNIRKVFMFLVEYKALEYFNYPLIRKYIKKLYQEKILISTTPTQIGEKNINCYHYFYPVKRIFNLRAVDINPELWFLCKEAEDKKLIKISFKFSWDKVEKDEIRNHLMDFFTYSNKEYKNLENNLNIDYEKFDSWNHFREKTIEKLLTKFIYPEMEKKLNEDINSFSEEIIIKKCVKRFKDIINIKPYKKFMNEKKNFESNLDEVKNSYKQYKLNVISILINDNDSNNGLFVFINEFGIMKKFLKIENIIKKNNDTQKKGLSNNDKQKLTDFIKNNFPDVIVMKANSILTQNLKKDINLIIQEIYDELKTEVDNLNSPFILWNTNDVSRIYSNSNLGKQEFKDLDQNIIECISMARYIQNPMAETLQLWNYKIEDNYLLYLNFHPSQEFVNKNFLKNELEKIIIEVVNEVGIDINEILKFKHLSNTLQFVNGLGPRKSYKLINNIHNKNGKLKSRKLLKNYLGTNVFTNCSGSFQIKSVFIDDEEDLCNENNKRSNPLDFTKIHPDYYRIIFKIASDVEEIEFKDEDLEEEGENRNKIFDKIIEFMEKPKLLKEIDFEDFEMNLSSSKEYNMTQLLNKIEKEINYPFKDNRMSYETKVIREDLFYKITNTSKFRILEESIVSCKIIKIESKLVKVLIDNSIPGIVLLQDLKERNFEIREDEIENFFNIGDFYMGKIKMIEFDMFRAKCTFRPDDLTNHKEYIRKNEILSKYELQENVNYFIDKTKDFPLTQNTEKKKKIMKFIPRKITHPKFKNMAYGTCLEFLRERALGEYIFRPSSKGQGNLNLSWKFYENNFVNLDIKEGYKTPNDKIASILTLDKHNYESLDEIIKSFIEPCNLLLIKCLDNKNFLKKSIDEITEILKNEFSENKNINDTQVFYYFNIVKEMPQYIILSYIFEKNDVIFESIKIKPDGYYFHNQKFSKFNNLVRYFKLNYNSSEYQNYLSQLPPINVGQSQTFIKKEEYGYKKEYKEEYIDKRYNKRNRRYDNYNRNNNKYRDFDKRRGRYNSYSSDDDFKKEYNVKKEYNDQNDFQYNN